MEKLIYPLWRASSSGGDDLRDALLDLAPQLLADEKLRGLRFAVADSAVAAAAGKRMASSEPLPDGVLSVWLDCAGSRQSLEALLERRVDRYSCYLVTEAEPLVNVAHPPVASERVHGMCQVVFLRRPPRLSREEWLAIWQHSHTQIAIDTQGTFGYRQNVIARALSPGASPLDAMVEENFPPGAMTSDHAFYGVEAGDDQGLQARQTALLASCARFMDFDQIDVIPMSEYVLRPPAGP